MHERHALCRVKILLNVTPGSQFSTSHRFRHNTGLSICVLLNHTVSLIKRKLVFFSLATMLFKVIYGGKKKLIKVDEVDYSSLIKEGKFLNY